MQRPKVVRSFGIAQVLGAVVVCLILGGISLRAEASAPKVDVYTMGEGPDITEAFGHAAICLRYPDEPALDLCYNYGTANFKDASTMGWEFLRARSKFWLGVVRPRRMMDHYVRRNRTVWVQELPLSESRAQAIATELEYTALPENRYYTYHHYWDNCSTRIRDLLDRNTEGELSEGASKTTGRSFRSYSRQGFSDSPAVAFASDLVLGRIGDHEASEYEAMFLPSVLRGELQKRYGAEPHLLYEGKGPPSGKTYVRFWALLIVILLVLPIWLAGIRGRRKGRWAIGALLVASLLGLLVWGLAAVSPLPMARKNEMLLLLFPWDLVFLFLSETKRVYYARFRVCATMLLAILAGVGILHQPLWALAPLPLLTFLPFLLFTKREMKQSN